METINLTVSGMTCGACVKHVEKTISSIVGVEKVEVDLASGSVQVTGNISHKTQEIVAALEGDGYPAEVAANKTGEEEGSSCKSSSSCCCG